MIREKFSSSQLKQHFNMLPLYLMGLALVLGIGMLALTRLHRIGITVDKLINELAVDRALAKDIVSQILLTRFYANRYVRTQSQKDLDAFNTTFAQLNTLLTKADDQITNPDRVRMLNYIKAQVATYGVTFEEVITLVKKRQRIYAEILDIQNLIMENSVSALRVDAGFSGDVGIFLAFGNLQNAIYHIHLNTSQYLDEGNPKYAIQLTSNYQAMLTALNSLETMLKDSSHRAYIVEIRNATHTYYTNFEIIRADYAQTQALLRTMFDELEPEISTTAAQMADSIEQEYQRQHVISQRLVAQTRAILLATTTLALLAGIGLIFVFSRYLAEHLRAEQALREHRDHLENVVAVRTTELQEANAHLRQEIAERAQAEEHILAQQRQLAALEERERLGRELHDNLGQVMAYAAIQLETVQDLLTASNLDSATAALTQLVNVARTAQADMRRYILGMRQAIPLKEGQDESFTALVEKYLATLRERYGLHVQVSWPLDLSEHPFALEVEGQVTRIIQEALTNVAKHAGVKTARLSLDLEGDQALFIIADDGRGIERIENEECRMEDARTETANHSKLAERQPHSKSTSTQHFGLAIMRERAAQIGGRLEIRSQPGQGTRITLRVPRLLTESYADTAAQAAVLRQLRVLLVDDHKVLLEGIDNALRARGINVVGHAHDGLEAQRLAQELRPDLILMDIHMPRCDGIEATYRIKVTLPEVKVVMLTLLEDEGLLFQSLKAGASGYLVKNLDGQAFISALLKIVQGEIVIESKVAAQILAEFAEQKTITPTPQPQKDEAISVLEMAASTTLTPRQLEVLQWVAQGLTYRAVGLELNIAESTVKYHMGQILETLQLKNKDEVVTYARHKGWLE